MRNLGENQNLFQILLIKLNRDMFLFPLNKIYFHNPQNKFSFIKYLGGMILAFYNIATFDKYFWVSWLRPSSQSPCMFDYRMPPLGLSFIL